MIIPTEESRKTGFEVNKRPAGRELDGTNNRHEEGFDARGEERESGEMGGTEGARVGGMEVGVIGKEERQPTDQKEGASPAACGCHHQAAEEEEKPSAHMSSLWANASRFGTGQKVHLGGVNYEGDFV